MDLDKFIEYLYVTNQVDGNFKLKEKCPQCGEPMDYTNDNAYPFYCPNCRIFVNKDKTEGVKEK